MLPHSRSFAAREGGVVMTGFKVRIDRTTHKKAYFVLFLFVAAAAVLTAKLFNMQIRIS